MLFPGHIPVHKATMTLFDITLCGRYRRHVLGQQIVSDVNVVRKLKYL